MSNFLEDIAFRQFENKLPEQYEDDEEPVACCFFCGDDIYRSEKYYSNGFDVMCRDCFGDFEECAERSLNNETLRNNR